MLSTDLMEDHPHDSRAGLQLADVIASAFYQAADCLGPGSWDVEPANAPTRIMAAANCSKRAFGVCLQPTPAWKADLTANQQQIFAHYGSSVSRCKVPGPVSQSGFSTPFDDLGNAPVREKV